MIFLFLLLLLPALVPRIVYPLCVARIHPAIIIIAVLHQLVIRPTRVVGTRTTITIEIMVELMLPHGITRTVVNIAIVIISVSI